MYVHTAAYLSDAAFRAAHKHRQLYIADSGSA